MKGKFKIKKTNIKITVPPIPKSVQNSVNNTVNKVEQQSKKIIGGMEKQFNSPSEPEPQKSTLKEDIQDKINYALSNWSNNDIYQARCNYEVHDSSWLWKYFSTNKVTPCKMIQVFLGN